MDRFSSKSTSGTLYLTATHLIFVESSPSSPSAAAQEIWVSVFGVCVCNRGLPALCCGNEDIATSEMSANQGQPGYYKSTKAEN